MALDRALRAVPALLAALTLLAASAADSTTTNAHLERLVGATVRSSLLAQLADALPAVNASCRCARDARHVVREALGGQVWALRWVDASARVPSGLLSGNVNQLGDYDECLAVEPTAPPDDEPDCPAPEAPEAPEAHPGGRPHSGTSYCLAAVALDLPEDAGPSLRHVSELLYSYTPFQSNFSDPGHRVPRFSAAYLGVCAPASCSPAELQAGLGRVLNAAAGAAAAPAPFRASFTPEMCRKQNEEPAAEGFGAWLARTSLWWLLGAVAFATFVDVVCLNGEGPAELLRWLNCLSLRQNWRRLTSVPDQHKRGDVAALHGVRGINALGLLVAHKSVAMLYLPYVNRTHAAAVIGMPWSVIGRVAILYTDCFILLSGALAALSLLRQLDRTGTVPLLRRMVDRYVRLTPLLAALIVLCTLLLPGLGAGPMWGMVVEPHAALCRRHWWRNLLYIHNFYGFENMCLTHTHQLGIDMQLFLAAPLLVYPLWRWPRRGALFLAALAAWSTALRYSVVVEHQLSTIVYFGVTLSQMFRTASLSYILPTHRLTVYILGVALGYALHRVPESFRFSSVVATLGWLVAVPLGLLPVFGPYETGTPAYRYDVDEAARYAAFAPILWSSFVCWGIFACSRGSGGWLRDFVCWRGWVVFTRIAFALYLAQFPVFFYNVGSNRHAQFYTIHSLLNFGEFALIMMVSVVLSLTFEMPFQELWKTYDQNRKGKGEVTSAPKPDWPLPSTAKRKSA